ncbi:hypothetical protein BRARA_G01616 [Brassica rapa]|uniref:Uncharacterized protein n=1 Tax=Brassica campestris TaxID=3711 RepID=A0A397YLK4_BRACM|nr:hypothetical protein BRARA_G01616 [Brassica rapa]
MEPTSLIDDAEFSLPPELLTDDDFLVEKENKVDRFGNCLFPYESSHFGSTVKPIDDEEEKLVAGLTSKMVKSSLEDDFSGGNLGSHAFPAGNDAKTQVSSQKVAWDLHYAPAEELNGYNNHNGRGLLDLPRKYTLAAAKITNAGSSYYNRQTLQYQRLQAIHFQQLKLKQQQLMKYHRQLMQQQSRGLGANNNSNNKIAGSVYLSPSAWSNQPQRGDVFVGNRTGKRGSTGTGVFLPRCVNHATAAVRQKPVLATGLVPARVVQPSVRSSPSLNDGSWSNDGGFSSQMKMEQPVKEDPRLPLDWAY